MMKKNYEYEEEVLENSVPEELKEYLDADETALGQIEGVLIDLDERMENLNAEREETKRTFEERLAEFKAMIEKERQEAFDEFDRMAGEIDAEKSRIEDIKLEQQSKQVNFIDSLKEISDTYNSKIGTIEEAIEACEGNTSLTKALEEEKENLEDALIDEYNSRVDELNDALVEVGFEIEPEIDPNQEINLDFRTDEEIRRDIERELREKNKAKIDPNQEINLDFRTPEEKERDLLTKKEVRRIDPNQEINLDFRTAEEIERDLLKNLETEKEHSANNLDLLDGYDDNEVVEYESREDVINEIYQSKDVMEGHVFPYLNSILE